MNKHGRVFNFSPGPCTLPVEVLEEAQADMLNYKGCGMGVMEMSHRGNYFRQIFESSQFSIRRLLGIPASHALLFTTGGGATQFAAVPLNLSSKQSTRADYAITGSWSCMAYQEALKLCTPRVCVNGQADHYLNIPDPQTWACDPTAAYLHWCDNETVHGVEFQSPPEVLPGVIRVSDMSSNFATRPVDWSKVDLAYGGAQKSLGPAGVTIVVANQSIIHPPRDVCPSMLSYEHTHKHNSLQNTPPCFCIYMVDLVCRHALAQGDLLFWNDLCLKKSGLLYAAIDSSEEFYQAPVAEQFRSRVNVRFNISAYRSLITDEDESLIDNPEKANPNEISAGQMEEIKRDHLEAEALDKDLEKKFLAEATEKGLLHLEGHRSLGGLRASLYAGLPMSGVLKLVELMKDFKDENTL